MIGAVVLAAAAVAVPAVAGSDPGADAATLPLAGKVVLLDPGHNGGNASHPAQINRQVFIGNGRKSCDTTGTATRGGYTEAQYTLGMAKRVQRILLARGARVVMTRTTNTGVGPCIDRRARIGNAARADAAVSIHADGGPSSGRGFHVIRPGLVPRYTNDIVRPSARLSLDLRAAFHRDAPARYATYIGRNGLDTRTDLGGLNMSDVPKVFIETGNMANAADARLLTSGAWRRTAAAAIARGIETYLRR